MMKTNALKRQVAIVGGYGNTGARIARHLAQTGNFEIHILGRSLARAEALVSQLAPLTTMPVHAGVVDVRDPDSLRGELGGVDLVICASTDSVYAANVAKAALLLGCDYLDTHLSSPDKWSLLRAKDLCTTEDDFLFF